MKDGLLCNHCLAEVEENSAIYETIDGQQHVFCCKGCQGVFHILHDAGLEDFYTRRRGWIPGPPDETEIDPAVFSGHIRESDSQREIEVHLDGIRCASCVWLIEHYLGKLPGVTEIRINYATHRARIRWKAEASGIEEIIKAIRSIGYTPRPAHSSDLQEAMRRETRDLLIRFGTAAFFSMQLMLYTVALYAGYFQGIEEFYRRTFQFIAWGLATPVLFYSGAPFLRNTLRGIRNRTINMDFLIFTGSFAAYAYSVVMIFTGGEVFFDTSAMIVTLILLGRFLESSAKSKAGEAIAALLVLQPPEARLVVSGAKDEKKMVPVGILNPGDVVEVRPGERVPVDGIVTGGRAEVDESMLTGESRPSEKTVGSEVFAGTMNMNGRLVIEVSRTEKETVLSGIIRAVEEAQMRKAPVQALADRVVGWFVPMVFSIALGTFVYWFMRYGDISTALMNSVSVLVVACPCALGLATPLAVLIGSTSASGKGILIRGGDVLERTSRVKSIIFDKTGTLTRGRPVLTDLVPAEEGGESLLRYAASLEAASEHSVGQAIRHACREDLYEVRDFLSLPGLGISGRVNNHEVLVGNIRLFSDQGVDIPAALVQKYEELAGEGKTVVFCAIDGRLKGLFAVSDILREDAAETMEKLKERGLSVMMVTGDNRKVAEAVASRAGITEVVSEVTPLEKAEVIKRLKEEKGTMIMMVGDGINDAPALTEADAGVSLGSATDIAIESADVVIVRERLILITDLINISRRTFSVIKGNLFWAFSYNFIAIPLAVTGALHPIVSAVSMAFSSLVVVGNSLRLRR